MAITAGMVTCFVLFDFFHLFGFFSSSGSCCGCIRVRRRMVLVHEGEADVEVPKKCSRTLSVWSADMGREQFCAPRS